MGLSFTNIEDDKGAALYILHNANTLEQKRLSRLMSEVNKITPHQTVMINVKSADGEKVRDFYDFPLDQLPVIFIIRDDDSIAHQWAGTNIPAADVIAHHLRKTSST